MTVGCQDPGFADTELRVHHLVLGAGRHHAGRAGFGAVLVAHHGRHLGADRAVVELDRRLALALEVQVRLDFHFISFLFHGQSGTNSFEEGGVYRAGRVLRKVRRIGIRLSGLLRCAMCILGHLPKGR